MSLLRVLIAVAIPIAFFHTAFGDDGQTRQKWRKHSINDMSPFEAVGVADFNGDGKLDVFSGDSWYAAPELGTA